MKINKSVFLSFLFLLLIVIVLVLKMNLWSEDGSNVTYFSGEINRFCINLLCMEKRENDWFVVGGEGVIPANNEVVDSFVKHLPEISLVETVSDNPDKFGDLGIGGEEAIILDIGGKRLEIGDNTRNYDGTFVRVENGRAVFRIGVLLTKARLSDINYWVKRTITNLSQQQVKKIMIVFRGKTYERLPTEGKWSDEKFIERISDLKSLKYLTDFQVDNLNSVYEFLIDYDEDKLVKIKIGKRDGKEKLYWATTDDKFYFEISEDDFNLLTAGLK